MTSCRTAPLMMVLVTVALLEMGLVQAADFSADVVPLLSKACVDCHSRDTAEGGVNLERFDSLQSAINERAIWKRIFDVVESGQMPLRDSGYELAPAERELLLNFVTELQGLPDPVLGAVDPGKPVLRRLTRLEYNNTVRDLFELPYDVFMFPERLPVADKKYWFESSGNEFGAALTTSMREYGQKYDVLLPRQGLPGDNRAEYGYANRGDALNFSPLLLEKYLEVAHAVAHSERLERDSPVMAGLLGRSWSPPARTAQTRAGMVGEVIPASRQYAPNGNVTRHAGQSDPWDRAFVAEVADAFDQGRGGTFDVPAEQNNRMVAGKGELIRISTSRVTLTINPNVDLWMASFATAQEASGDHLLTNRIKGEKTFELTFQLESTEAEAGIESLGICVLARRNQDGPVTLTAILANGREISRSAEIDPDEGNVFFSFVAPPGTVIRRLRVDGSRFSGDYVLLDDLGFIVRGVDTSRELPQVVESDSDTSPEPESVARRFDPTLSRGDRFALFLERAYRRSVSESEVNSIIKLMQEAMAGGMTETDAVRMAVQSVLSSPDFLFLSEPVDPSAQAIRPLNDFELANRLSYFLWSSMPDDDLLALAARGELGRPAALRQQVRLMLLNRRRSRELSESFAVQWLKLDQLYSAKPDRRLFDEFYSGPQGKSTLHGPMLTEPLLLFETVLVEDRSVLELCDPRFTWLNEQLAELYGLQGPFRQARESAAARGVELDHGKRDRNWYRVALPDQTRGGVMTMAGTLMLTSLPFRTSPVKRGAWLLETIFNRPPAEPKVAFVLEDDAATSDTDLSTLSVRQRFERHRSDPNCFSCHSRIDPPGFSLEAFDAIGRFRTHDGPQPVDASGIWNGTPFTGPAEFKSALRRREQEFVRGFVEHLLSYSLGRPVEHYDMPAVNQIVVEAAEDGYRISRIIEEIVMSYPFRQTRNDIGERP